MRSGNRPSETESDFPRVGKEMFINFPLMSRADEIEKTHMYDNEEEVGQGIRESGVTCVGAERDSSVLSGHGSNGTSP